MNEGLRLRKDASDMSREKAAFLLSVVTGRKVGAGEVREVENQEEGFVIHLTAGGVYQGTGFEAIWLRHAIRSPAGWALPETF